MANKFLTYGEEEWPKLKDKQLITEAQTGVRGQGVVVEAMRRLRISIDALRKSIDRYSWLLIGLTVVLAALTAVLAYKAVWP